MSADLWSKSIASAGDLAVFDACEIAAGEPDLDGYWSIFSALSWVASGGDSKFLAAVQRFEELNHANRGSAHSFAALSALSAVVFDRYDVSLEDAIRSLLKKLRAANGITGVVASYAAGNGTVNIERSHWNYWEISFLRNGIALLSEQVGFVAVDFWFPAEAVQAAFPVSRPPFTKRQAATCTNAEILERCDFLWLAGANGRDLAKLLPKEPAFRGVKAQLIRDLTFDRYPRTGRGERKPEHIRQTHSPE